MKPITLVTGFVIKIDSNNIPVTVLIGQKNFCVNIFSYIFTQKYKVEIGFKLFCIPTEFTVPTKIDGKRILALLPCRRY